MTCRGGAGQRCVEIFKVYQRCIQKVLYRRGNGRTFLSKSHLIEFVELLSDNIPDAKFIDIVRHPKDSIVSWMALQSAGSRRFVNYEFPKKDCQEMFAGTDLDIRGYDVVGQHQ